MAANGRIYIGTFSWDGGLAEFFCFGTPAPTIDNITDNQNVSGTVKLQGTALGDSVEAVKLNWGEGWVRATKLRLEREHIYNTEGPGKTITCYVNYWSQDWNTRNVPNGERALRARILYSNGAIQMRRPSPYRLITSR